MSYLLEMFGRALPDRLLQVLRERISDSVAAAVSGLNASAADGVDFLAERARQGLEALTQGQPGQAKSQFEKVLRVHRRHRASLLGLACAYDDLGQPERALRYLEIARETEPTDHRLLFAMGLLHERCGNPTQAKAFYLQSLYFKPDQKASRHRLAAIALADENIEAALHQAEALAAQHPTDLRCRLRLAGLYLLAGEYSRALKSFQTAMRLIADNWTSTPDKAWHLEQAGEIDEAIAELQRAIAENGNLPDLHLRLGDLYGKAGQSDAALEHYMCAYSANPNYLEAAVRIAACHIKAARWVEGALWLGKAMDINETLVATYLGLAAAADSCGDDAHAEEALQMARSIAANSPILLAQVVKLHELVTKRRISFETWDADEDDTADETACVLESIDLHKRYLADSDQDAGAWLRLGLLCEFAGYSDEAQQAFRNAVSIYPGFSTALARIATAASYRPEQARRCLSRLFSLEEIDTLTHYQLALLFSQPQRFELAIDAYAPKLPADQRNCFWKNLAVSLEQMGMLDKAKGLWQSLCEMRGLDHSDLLAAIGFKSETSSRRM